MANICNNIISATGAQKASADAKAKLTGIDIDAVCKLVGINCQRWEGWEQASHPSRFKMYVGSAWNPCEQLVAALSQTFPQLKWTLDYCEQGNWFAGRTIYQAGKIRCQREGSPTEHWQLYCEDYDYQEKLDEFAATIPPREPTLLPIFAVVGWQKKLIIPAENEVEAAAAFLYHHVPYDEHYFESQLDRVQNGEPMPIKRIDVGETATTEWSIRIAPTGQLKNSKGDRQAQTIVMAWLLKNL